jgi:hypothetical protein
MIIQGMCERVQRTMPAALMVMGWRATSRPSTNSASAECCKC